MKNFFALTMALLLTAVLLAGCTSAVTQSTSSAAPAASSAAPAASSKSEAAPASTAGGEAKNAADLKVAVVLNSSITDGWSSGGYAGLQLIEETFGCETSYIENVSKQDMEAAFRNYASEGYDVVFAHGSEFADAMKVVAPEFPETIFVVNSYKEAQAPNMASLSLNNREQGFLVGTVAAAVSENGVMAAMNGSESDSVKDSIAGQRAALSLLRPDMKHVDSWTGDPNDATKAYEMAQTLIKEGADIIVSDPGQMSQGILQACEETGANCIGVVGNLAELNPKVVITSARSSYAKAMVAFMNEVIAGTWEAKSYPSGIKEDAVFIEPYGEFEDILTDEQKKEIQDTIDKVKSGEIDINALVEALPA